MLTRVLFALAAMTGPAAALELSVPIACTPGVDCFVQQYVDRDKGPGVRDYACGAETYDGHKGADIRLRTTAEVAKGVGVLASAPGTVIGARDGMADHLVRTDADRAGVAALECGNGVRIDHGEGWITQYCHMRKGSIAVKKGDEVKLGAKLGEEQRSRLVCERRARRKYMLFAGKKRPPGGWTSGTYTQWSRSCATASRSLTRRGRSILTDAKSRTRGGEGKCRDG
jgi:hypothetical protein